MPSDTNNPFSNFAFPAMTTPSQPIKTPSARRRSIARSPFSSYLSASPIAHESIARDLAECSDDDGDTSEPESPSSEDEGSEASTVRQEPPQHSMTSSYRRPRSFVAFGGTRPAITPQIHEANWLTKKEKKQSRLEERSLLRDNHLGEFRGGVIFFYSGWYSTYP